MSKFVALCERLIRELETHGSHVLTTWLPKIVTEAKREGVPWCPGKLEQHPDEVRASLYDPLVRSNTRYWLFPVVKPSQLIGADTEALHAEYRRTHASERLDDIIETVRAWISCSDDCKPPRESSEPEVRAGSTFGQYLSHITDRDVCRRHQQRESALIDGPAERGTAAAFHTIEAARWFQDAGQAWKAAHSLVDADRVQGICEAEFGEVNRKNLLILRGRLAGQLRAGTNTVDSLPLCEFAKNWSARSSTSPKNKRDTDQSLGPRFPLSALEAQILSHLARRPSDWATHPEVGIDSDESRAALEVLKRAEFVECNHQLPPFEGPDAYAEHTSSGELIWRYEDGTIKPGNSREAVELIPIVRITMNGLTAVRAFGAEIPLTEGHPAKVLSNAAASNTHPTEELGLEVGERNAAPSEEKRRFSASEVAQRYSEFPHAAVNEYAAIVRTIGQLYAKAGGDPEDFEFQGYMWYFVETSNATNEAVSKIEMQTNKFARAMKVAQHKGFTPFQVVDVERLSNMSKLLAVVFTHEVGVELCSLHSTLQHNLEQFTEAVDLGELSAKTPGDNEKRATTDASEIGSEPVGPFQLQWLKLIFDIDHDETLKKRLGADLSGSGRQWHVSHSRLDAMGDWKNLLLSKLDGLPIATQNRARTFLGSVSLR